MEDNNTRILRGHINIMILKALEEGEKYGYEIGKYIEAKSEGQYILKQPTLYSSLSRLEQKDILTSYWGDELDTNGGRRKYFRLTELGKKIAEKNITEWNEHRKLIDKIVSNDTPKQKEFTANITNQKAEIENKFELTNTVNNSYTQQNLSAQNLVYNDKINEKLNFQSVRFASNDSKDKGNEYKHILSKLMDNVKNRKVEPTTLARDEVEKIERFNTNNDLKLFNQEIEKSKQETGFIKDLNEAPITRAYNLNIPLSSANIDNKPISGAHLENKPLSENSLLNRNDYDIDIKDKTTSAPLYNLQPDKPKDSSQHKYSLLPSTDFAQNSFTRLQRQMLQEGYSVRPHTNLKKESKQFILENKLSYISMLFLYLVMAIEVFAIYSIFESVISIGLNYYLYAAAALLSFPLAATIQYIVAPNKRTRKKMDIKGYIITSIMYYLTAVLFIVAIALIFNTNTAIKRDLILKIIIPSIFAANYIFYAIIKSIVYKTKKCHI